MGPPALDHPPRRPPPARRGGQPLRRHPRRPRCHHRRRRLLGAHRRGPLGPPRLRRPAPSARRRSWPPTPPSCRAVRALAGALGARFQPDLLITAGVGPSPRRTLRPSRRAHDLRRSSPPPSAPSQAAAAAPIATLAEDADPAGGPALCAIGRSSLAVDPYGTVFPCVEVRRTLGTIRHTPLAAIWHDLGAWAPYLRLSRPPAISPAISPAITLRPPGSSHRPLPALPVCRTCRLGPWCIRCHGAAANETGDLYGPSPAHCAAAKARRALWSSSAPGACTGPPGAGAIPPPARD